MISENEKKLIECIDEKLKPYSFERIGLSSFPQALPILAAWKRRTWNTNRAVAIIRLVNLDDDLGKFAQSIKFHVGKLIGYLTFIYPLGLQVILIGSAKGNAEDLKKYTDKFDNQRVVMQSIHVVDLASMKSVSVRTWGQYMTGRFQDAIESGIQTFLNNN